MNELSMFQSLKWSFDCFSTFESYTGQKNFQNEGLGNFDSLTVAGSR